MVTSLAELARAIHAEERGDLPSEVEERADAVARRLREERPDVTVRGAQTAAARVVGVDTPTERHRQASDIEKTGKRRRRRVRRRVRRLAKGPRRRGITSLGLRAGRASAGGLIAQALGLVLLYWIVRNADTAGTALAGIRRGLGWVFDPTTGIS